MTRKELKNNLLEQISTERQLADAEERAGNTGMYLYHKGRMEVALDIHEKLVRYFKDEPELDTTTMADTPSIN